MAMAPAPCDAVGCAKQKPAGAPGRRRRRYEENAAQSPGRFPRRHDPVRFERARVVILASTYDKNGFADAEALAAQDQFGATLSLDFQGGTTASGTWIGNDEAAGYILTAAHNFCPDPGETGFRPAATYKYRTRDETSYDALEVTVNPEFACEKANGGDDDDHDGYDVAIVRLSRPVTGLDEPPLLNGGVSELGKKLTFVGYGTRGTGDTGETMGVGDGPAAAEGIVEETDDAMETDDSPPKSVGNYMVIWLPREDGSIPDPLDPNGAVTPVSPLAGLLGQGDSGGGAWILTDAGWVLAGVNASGSGEAQYGDTSNFARVAGLKNWIVSVFPDARFTGS